VRRLRDLRGPVPAWRPGGTEVDARPGAVRVIFGQYRRRANGSERGRAGRVSQEHPFGVPVDPAREIATCQCKSGRPGSIFRMGDDPPATEGSYRMIGRFFVQVVPSPSFRMLADLWDRCRATFSNAVWGRPQNRRRSARDKAALWRVPIRRSPAAAFSDSISNDGHHGLPLGDAPRSHQEITRHHEIGKPA